MIDEFTVIPVLKNYTIHYSICTIVNNWQEYDEMKHSFISKGFVSETEYLVIDNTGQNNLDAYKAIRRFLKDATGKYIIIVHQDVRCIDDIEKLSHTLKELEHLDPLWSVCGNAGGNGYKNFIFNLENNGKVKKTAGLPARVTSLDENLLIIKNDCQLTVSADIESFHFYGTVLCIISDFLGYHCYVIDFMVAHLSAGNLKHMDEYKPTFIGTYGRKFRDRFIQTTCTKFYLSDSASKNRLYNKGFIFFWIKAANRFGNIFKR